MPIHHIGQSTIHSHDRDLILRNILHVPSASKNHVSIHKFTPDNNAFFEIHPWYCFLKDQDTRKLLLQGKCRNGLYPLPTATWSPSSCPQNKIALSAAQPTMARWHYRLGHASSPIVHHVINQNKLLFSEKNLEKSVCDACQQAKSHQLPFPKSTSVSTTPLELVFLDVWGPVFCSVGNFNYYVAFIDNFSKFTWVYLLKNKSDVFHKFHEFQTMVE
jgi:hypothetical protein